MNLSPTLVRIGAGQDALREVGFREGLGGNGLVSVVGMAVGEEVIDEHADDGKEEYDESPDDLVGYGAVGLEDLNCRTVGSA